MTRTQTMIWNKIGDKVHVIIMPFYGKCLVRECCIFQWVLFYMEKVFHSSHLFWMQLPFYFPVCVLWCMYNMIVCLIFGFLGYVSGVFSTACPARGVRPSPGPPPPPPPAPLWRRHPFNLICCRPPVLMEASPAACQAPPS